MTERLFSIGYAAFLSLELEVVCLTDREKIFVPFLRKILKIMEKCDIM